MSVIRNFKSIELALMEIESGKYYYTDGNIVRKKTGKPVGYKCGKGGYMGYGLRENGVKFRVLVHRVIFALHYGIEELKKHETIDHINGNKYDNRIENLQGMSVLDNNSKFHDYNYNKIGRKLERHQVVEIRDLLNTRITIKRIAEKYNVSPTTIAYIRDGKTYRSIV